MTLANTYSKRERISLWILATCGFVVVNGMFLYAAFWQPESIADAMSNPLAVAFVLESVLLLVALSYLLTRWRVSGVRWEWFVVLSLLGSIAFALPMVLLWNDRRTRTNV